MGYYEKAFAAPRQFANFYTMQKLSSLLLILFICQSCFQNNDGSREDSLGLNDYNEVIIVYYNHNDTLTYNTKDTNEVKILQELISVRQDKIGDSCKPAGQLIFKSHGQSLLGAEFSTLDTNEEVDCNYVVYKLGTKRYKHKLTYRAGRLIDETLRNLRSSTVKFNLDSIEFYKDTISQ